MQYFYLDSRSTGTFLGYTTSIVSYEANARDDTTLTPRCKIINMEGKAEMA